jgi:hypothetical protein
MTERPRQIALKSKAWIPAYAGMTEVGGTCISNLVIPAQAGIHPSKMLMRDRVDRFEE